MVVTLTKQEIREIHEWMTTWNQANVHVPHELKLKIARYNFEPLGITGQAPSLVSDDSLVADVELTADEIKCISQCIKLNFSNMNINAPKLLQYLVY